MICYRCRHEIKRRSYLVEKRWYCATCYNANARRNSAEGRNPQRCGCGQWGVHKISQSDWSCESCWKKDAVRLNREARRLREERQERLLQQDIQNVRDGWDHEDPFEVGFG